MSDPVQIIRVAEPAPTRVVRPPAPTDAEITIPLRITLGQLADVDDDNPPPPADEPLALQLDGQAGVYRLVESPAAVTPDEVTDEVAVAVTAHVLDPEPHPAYDDGPSLVVLFENGLV